MRQEFADWQTISRKQKGCPKRTNNTSAVFSNQGWVCSLKIQVSPQQDGPAQARGRDSFARVRDGGEVRQPPYLPRRRRQAQTRLTTARRRQRASSAPRGNPPDARAAQPAAGQQTRELKEQLPRAPGWGGGAQNAEGERPCAASQHA